MSRCPGVPYNKPQAATVLNPIKVTLKAVDEISPAFRSIHDQASRAQTKIAEIQDLAQNFAAEKLNFRGIENSLPALGRAHKIATKLEQQFRGVSSSLMDVGNSRSISSLAKVLGNSYREAEQFAREIGQSADNVKLLISRIQELDEVEIDKASQFKALREETGGNLRASQFKKLNDFVGNSNAAKEFDDVANFASSLGKSFSETKKLTTELGLGASKAEALLGRLQQFESLKLTKGQQFSKLNQEFGITNQQFGKISSLANGISSKGGLAGILGGGAGGGGLAGIAGQLGPIVGVVGGIAAGIAAAGAAASGLIGFLKEGVQRNEELNQQLLESQANLANSTRIFKGGSEVTDPLAKVQASAAALRTALKTIEVETQELVGVTSSEVNQLFQITLQNAGALNRQSKEFPGAIDAATKLTKGWAAGLKVVGVPLASAGQEINSILKGTIDSNSALAKSLGINNEQVKKWKSQGVLVDQLNKKLEVFVQANKIAAATSIAGAGSNIQDIFEVVQREVSAPLQQPVVDVLNTIFEQLKGKQDQIIEVGTRITSGLVEAFERVAIYFEPAIDALQPILAEVVTWIEPISGMINSLIELIGGALANSITVLAVGITPMVKILGVVIKAIDGVLKAIVTLNRAARPFIDAFLKQMTDGQKIIEMFFGGFIKWLTDAGKKLAGSVLGKLIIKVIGKLKEMGTTRIAGRTQQDIEKLAQGFDDLQKRAAKATFTLNDVKADPKKTAAAADDLIKATYEQFRRQQITAEEVEGRLIKLLDNGNVPKAMKKRASEHIRLSKEMEKTMGADRKKTVDAVRKAASQQKKELEDLATGYTSLKSKAEEAFKVLADPDAFGAQRNKSGGEALKATQEQLKKRQITIAEAQKRFKQIASNDGLDVDIRDNAKLALQESDKFAKDLGKKMGLSGDALAKADAEFVAKVAKLGSEQLELRGRTVLEKGDQLKQLAKKVSDAEKLIKEDANGDEPALNDAAKTLIDLTKQQVELGQITAQDAQKRLTQVAKNTKLEGDIQKQALDEISGLRDKAAERAVNAEKTLQSKLELEVMKGTKTREQADIAISESKVRQAQIQLKTAKDNLKQEELLGRGKGEKAVELRQKIEELETEVQKEEGSKREKIYQAELSKRQKLTDEFVNKVEQLTADERLGEAASQKLITEERKKAAADRVEIAKKALADEVKAGRGNGERARELKKEMREASLEKRQLGKELRELERQETIKDFDEQQTILEAKRSLGAISEAEFNQQRLDNALAQADAELAIVAEKRSRLNAEDTEGMEALAAEEAAILKKRVDAQVQFYQDSLAQLEEAQAQARDIVRLSQVKREADFAKLKLSQQMREEDLAIESTKIQRTQIEDELKLENDRLRQLRALPPTSDPAVEEQRQAQIRASKIRTAEISKQLLDNELSQQQALSSAISKLIQRQMQEKRNAADAQVQAVEAEGQLLERNSKVLQTQQQLLEARANLTRSISGFLQQQAGMLMQTAKTEEEKKQLAFDTADIKLRALQREQQINRQILEMNIRQKEIALEKEKSANRIAQIQNRAEQLQAEAALKQAAAKPNANQEEIDAAKLALQAKQAQGLALQLQGEQLKEQGQINKQFAELEKFQLDLNQRSALDAAQLERANADTNQDRGQRDAEAIRVRMRKEFDQGLRDFRNGAFGPDLSLPETSQKVAALENQLAQLTKPLSVVTDQGLAGKQQQLEAQLQRSINSGGGSVNINTVIDRALSQRTVSTGAAPTAAASQAGGSNESTKFRGDMLDEMKGLKQVLKEAGQKRGDSSFTQNNTFQGGQSPEAKDFAQQTWNALYDLNEYNKQVG